MRDAAIGDAIRTTGMTPTQVWLGYMAIGGSLPREDLAGRLDVGRLDGVERAVLVEFLNDWFTDRAQSR